MRDSRIPRRSIMPARSRTSQCHTWSRTSLGGTNKNLDVCNEAEGLQGPCHAAACVPAEGLKWVVLSLLLYSHRAKEYTGHISQCLRCMFEGRRESPHLGLSNTSVSEMSPHPVDGRSEQHCEHERQNQCSHGVGAAASRVVMLAARGGRVGQDVPIKVRQRLDDVVPVAALRQACAQPDAARVNGGSAESTAISHT